MKCPDDAELLALLHGDLSPEDRASREAHLDGCPSCLALVAEIARTSAVRARDDERVSLDKPGPLLAGGEPRYVPGDEIARGGMGRILAAEDRLLGRRVALKLLRRASADLALRFAREQRITARLQHPAIIPVYDAGTLMNGEPFFVMRLIKGESLDKSAAGARSMEDRLRLLPAVIGVVDAIAYAHGEGVVHRDLKPQNVLVGPFGEVVVLDWGLAREERRADVTAPGDGPSPHEDEPDPAATRAGDVLGTLAYMAPEQVEGREADARSDVYGLGAMLYHVLTGAPPHAERSASLSTGSARHAPDPIARRAPDAPPDLTAIVERAMAEAPEHRYPSARELADDLKRWQTGRLVEAHRYTLRDLARRFVRRYRAPLFVGAASLLVLLVVGALGLRRIVSERARALREQARAEAALAKAEAERAAAESLAGFMLGDLRARLERVGRLDVLEGVARAVIAYQDSSPAAEDKATSLRRAEVAGLAGDVAFAIGDLGAADESYHKSRSAAEQAGAVEGALEARCQASIRLGDVRKRRGEIEAASSLYEGCAASVGEEKGSRAQELWIHSRIALAELARIRGDLPRSRAILEGALPRAEALIAASGGPGADAGKTLLTVRSDLTKTLNLAGEVRAEREGARATLDFARARAAARPDDMGARYDVAVAEVALGAAALHGGDAAAAEQSYRRAIAEHRLLAARDPSNAEWQRAVGVVAERLGSLMVGRGDAKAALPWLKESDDVSLKIVAIAPNNLEWQRDVGVSKTALGDVLAALGRLDEARIEFERAVSVLDELAGKAPNAGRSEHDLGVALGHLGELEFKAGKAAAGRAAQARSITLLKRHLALVDTPQTRHELAAALLILAENEVGSDARAHIDEALSVLDPVRGLAPANRDLSDLLAEAEKMRDKAKGR